MALDASSRQAAAKPPGLLAACEGVGDTHGGQAAAVCIPLDGGGLELTLDLGGLSAAFRVKPPPSRRDCGSFPGLLQAGLLLAKSVRLEHFVLRLTEDCDD